MDAGRDAVRRVRRLRQRARDTAERTRERAVDRGERWHARAPGPLQRAVTLVSRTGREVVDDRVPGLAAEAALFTLISLPALVLVVLGSLGFVAEALGPAGNVQLQRIVFDLPSTVLSDRTYDAYADLARRVLDNGRADVISLGALLSIYTGSRATARYLETLAIAYDLERRPTWRRRILAIGLTIGALVGAVAVLPLLVLGPALVRGITPPTVADATLELVGLLYWPAIGLVVLAGLTTAYHVGVPWRTPWRRDLPGALVALALWIASAAGLRAYLALSTGDDAVYAQLGTPIAVVLWLYVTAFAVLLGAELNAEIEKMWPTGALDGDEGPGVTASRPHG